MKRGPRQVLIAWDEFVNALLMGDAHHTISARTGYALYRGKRWAKVVAPLIDRFFCKDHCTNQAKAEGLI